MRIPTSIFLLASILIFPIQASGKELPKIAVWDLVPRNISADYAHQLSDILASELTKLGKYEVYSQENVRTLAGWEAQKMSLGCTDAKCLTALGQVDIAKLISGSVGKIGNRYSVSLSLFDMLNISAENKVSEFCNSENELIELVQHAVRKLVGAPIVLSIPSETKRLESGRKSPEDEKKIRYDKPAYLSIATGLAWGTFYDMGVGMAEVLSKYIPNTKATVEWVRDGSVGNCKLLGSGKTDLALTSASVGYAAFTGTEMFKDIGPISIRTIGIVFSSVLHLLTKEGLGISSIYDLRNRRVSMGMRHSGTEQMAMRVLESYGIDIQGEVKWQGLDEATDGSLRYLRDGRVDACTISGRLPIKALLDYVTSSRERIKILNCTDHLGRINAKYGPIYFLFRIPQNTYPRMDSEAHVLAEPTLLVCNAKLDDELVYDITKALLENQAKLEAICNEAREFTLAKAVVGSPMPFHPGAIKYFRERGIRIN